jgi:hypothetical protein
MREEENVLRILIETKVAFQKDDPYELKKLSNQTIHSATVSQDPDNVIVAVLVYSLGKILERSNYREMQGWQEFYNATNENLDSAIKSLQNKDVEKCRISLGKIRNFINKLSGDLSEYIRDIFRKAEINKAFKIYEHGISSEQTAELLGVSLWDLPSYIGQSTISEAKVSISMPIKKRIKIAEDFLK